MSTYERLKAASCYEQAPPHEQVVRRVRCNRPAGHDGPHQRIRPADFLVVWEWTHDGGYTRRDGKAV